MESEEYMNRKQQEAEKIEVSILLLIIITRHSKRVTRSHQALPRSGNSLMFLSIRFLLLSHSYGSSIRV